VYSSISASYRLTYDRGRGWRNNFERLAEPKLFEAYRSPGAWADSAGHAVVLTPRQPNERDRFPLVVCLCQEGMHRFLSARSPAVAALLQARVAVLLFDWPGGGQSRPGDGRGRTSWAATLASTAEMLGQSLGGARLAATHTMIHLARRDLYFVDGSRIVLWGEGLSEPNPPDQVAIPYDLGQPRLAEPFAAVTASLKGLGAKENLKAVVARGGLVSYRSVLESPFVHVPHDALPINVFRAGDLPDVWAHLVPKPLRLEGLVDGTNRRVTGDKLKEALRPVTEAYKKGGLVVKEDYTPDAEVAKWIVEQLKK
jgi:pimeloyl-ACP methyl ester carboxylesterase